MIRRVEWAAAAINDLQDLPDWKIASDIDAAVRLFALTGHGPIVRVPIPNWPDDVRLYVPPHPYYVALRYSDDVVYVERIRQSP